MTEQLSMDQQIDQAAAFLASQMGDSRPEILLVLGSGLNHVAHLIDSPLIVPFADVPYLCESTVSGHMGQFVFGELGGKRVLVMQGRLHAYEGYAAQEVAFPVWIGHKLGARILFTTNAAGAITEGLHPGDFCVVSDHINFSGHNPVEGFNVPTRDNRFFSMEDAYDADLRATALRIAVDAGIPIREGVYLGLLGPSFETPAEIRMFASWGADTVAMSMIEEVIAARYVGMRVLGINLISNYAAGTQSDVSGGIDFSEEIIKVTALAGERAEKLIEGTIAALDV